MNPQDTSVLEDSPEFIVTRNEGWLQYVDRGARTKPEVYSRGALAKLSKIDRLRYDETRKSWHSNLGPIKTPQMSAVTQGLEEIVDSAREDGDKVKGSAVVDAKAGLGKTTAVLQFARSYHREQIELYSALTQEGNLRLPVAIVSLPGSVTIKGLNRLLCNFYGVPSRTGNTDDLRDRVLDAVLTCRTKVIVIDDIHFLNMNRHDHREVINHLKHLSSTLPVVFVFVGVGIDRSGLLREGLVHESEEQAQVARRWTRLSIDRFEVNTEEGRRTWRTLLLTIERSLVLSAAHPGMVVDDLSDYLFIRSSGHFASLMTILKRGCNKAIRSGEERLTVETLDTIQNDAASERVRQELASAVEQGLVSSRPRRHRGGR